MYRGKIYKTFLLLVIVLTFTGCIKENVIDIVKVDEMEVTIEVANLNDNDLSEKTVEFDDYQLAIPFDTSRVFIVGGKKYNVFEISALVDYELESLDLMNIEYRYLFGNDYKIDGTLKAVCKTDLFQIRLYSVKDVYSPTEDVNIFGTVEYIGEDDLIIIRSGIPYIGFSVVNSVGVSFIQNMQLTILNSYELMSGEVYHHSMGKSGGFSEDQEDADFWRSFYQEERMLFPVGTYTVWFIPSFDVGSSTSDQCSLEYQFEVR